MLMLSKNGNDCCLYLECKMPMNVNIPCQKRLLSFQCSDKISISHKPQGYWTDVFLSHPFHVFDRNIFIWDFIPFYLYQPQNLKEVDIWGRRCDGGGQIYWYFRHIKATVIIKINHPWYNIRMYGVEKRNRFWKNIHTVQTVWNINELVN